MKKLIFVEGLPGSGKSSFLERCRKSYSAEEVFLFYEHDSRNSIDITRKAFLREHELRSFIEECQRIESKYDAEDIESRILEHTTQQGEWFVVAYMQIYFAVEKLQEKVLELRQYEFCDGHVEAAEYEACILNCFRNLKEEQLGKYNVYEGALIQNPLFDLQAFYQFSQEKILDLYKKIWIELQDFDVKIIYLHTKDIKHSLLQTGQHRKKYRWLELFIQYVEESPYGKTHDLKKIDGYVQFCDEMQRISLDILTTLWGPHLEIWDSDEFLEKEKGEYQCLI